MGKIEPINWNLIKYCICCCRRCICCHSKFCLCSNSQFNEFAPSCCSRSNEKKLGQWTNQKLIHSRVIYLKTHTTHSHALPTLSANTFIYVFSHSYHSYWETSVVRWWCDVLCNSKQFLCECPEEASHLILREYIYFLKTVCWCCFIKCQLLSYKQRITYRVAAGGGGRLFSW